MLSSVSPAPEQTAELNSSSQKDCERRHCPGALSRYATSAGPSVSARPPRNGCSSGGHTGSSCAARTGRLPGISNLAHQLLLRSQNRQASWYRRLLPTVWQNGPPADSAQQASYLVMAAFSLSIGGMAASCRPPAAPLLNISTWSSPEPYGPGQGFCRFPYKHMQGFPAVAFLLCVLPACLSVTLWEEPPSLP